MSKFYGEPLKRGQRLALAPWLEPLRAPLTRIIYLGRKRRWRAKHR